MPAKPTVLTIAGFDPSACAGLLADIKTFEAHKVYGMAVCTSNTIQNIQEFKEPNWISPEEILNQLRFLQKEVTMTFVKIGLIENFYVLDILLTELLSHNKEIKIIWDPICKASAPFSFHSQIDKEQLQNICSRLYLLTPNLDELAILTPGMTPAVAGRYLSEFCNTLIKGGHGKENTSTDTLYFNDSGSEYGSELDFKTERLFDFSKRGTGCVLSSAILANLANGYDLVQSCDKAKKYITKYIISNNSLVGEHHHEIHQ